MANPSRQIGSIFVLIIAVAAVGVGRPGTDGPGTAEPGSQQDSSATDPWSAAQLVQPAALVHQLNGPARSRPLVLCVGFDFLYQSAHIPGALLYGPGREPSGLKALADAAKAWQHDRDIVIYCGCCPMKQCPNLRPAFRLLRDRGFTRLRVLDLERDFRQDWLQNTLPSEKLAGK
jgi:thiosulfate/3-mercaptopyruvate sulfurtransferase